MKRRDAIVVYTGPCGACGEIECEATDEAQCAAWSALADARMRLEGRMLDGRPVTDRAREIVAQRIAQSAP